MRTPILRPSQGAQQGDVERRVAALEQALGRVSAPVQQTSQTSTKVIKQTTHGLAVGNVVRHNGTAWVKAQADTAANAVVGGIVLAVLSPSLFVLATAGYVAGLSGLTAGSVHYLSAATAGAVTTTAPTIAVPVVLASATSDGVLMSGWPASTASSLSFQNTSRHTGTDGSFSIPGGVTKIRAVLIGASGGGGSGYPNTAVTLGYVASSSGGSPTTALKQNAGGGGGGGGACVVYDLDVAGLSTLTITLGTAGTGGAATGYAGTAGSATTVTGTDISLVADGGGGGGYAGNTYTPGNGGTGGFGSYAGPGARVSLTAISAGASGDYGYVVTYTGTVPRSGGCGGLCGGWGNNSGGTSGGAGGDPGSAGGNGQAGAVFLYY
jgi:hypothetical protein